MPILERDPWRMQYFEHVDCPEDVVISTDDTDSYALYPEHRWIHNKLVVAESQGLACAPHGIVPSSFPVFSKPVYNLRGMGLETRIFSSLDEYLAERDPGHMWVELLKGEHLSSDVAVVKGHAAWWRHVAGKPGPHQTFDHWTILAETRSDVEAYCADWIGRHFQTYTGMVNLETIGGRIIEGHLRFADQWPDLYGKGWLEAVVRLYAEGVWSFDDTDRRQGYSVVLHEAHGVSHRHPPTTLVDAIRRDPLISSVQITFHEDRPPELHAMPPGGFRIAIINCWDLDAGDWPPGSGRRGTSVPAAAVGAPDLAGLKRRPDVGRRHRGLSGGLGGGRQLGRFADMQPHDLAPAERQDLDPVDDVTPVLVVVPRFEVTSSHHPAALTLQGTELQRLHIERIFNVTRRHRTASRPA